MNALRVPDSMTTFAEPDHDSPFDLDAGRYTMDLAVDHLDPRGVSVYSDPGHIVVRYELGGDRFIVESFPLPGDAARVGIRILIGEAGLRIVVPRASEHAGAGWSDARKNFHQQEAL